MDIVSIVRILHILLVLFIIAVPFTNNEWLLTMHIFVVPAIILHWITNNNICSLTLFESQLTGIPVEKTFIGRILFPFFRISNMYVYTIIIGLWVLAFNKVRKTNFSLLKESFRRTLGMFI